MYTQLWLDKAANENNTKVIVEGFDSDNPVIKNAIKEIKDRQCLCDEVFLLEKVESSEVNSQGYILNCSDNNYTIKASDEKGLIYGVFRMINLIKLKKANFVSLKEEPQNPLRMLNHWDNMDGSIERGYSGNSFFFVDNDIVINDRTVQYARFLSSLGYNGVVINNVNVKQAACDLINDKFIHKVKKLSDIFTSFGVDLYLSLNYAAPIDDENVNSADPLDEKVINWWEKKFKYIYSIIPELGGFLVKADSEGRPGPFTYGRNQAEGANMLGRAIKPYGGIIIWRCFVYNCQQTFRDFKTDRARAAYDYFHDLDGEFEDNVILQIKNGPMDFQVREPVTPLFGGMSKTNQMIEYQIAQEYTGQQRHVCYLIPWFKEVLSFETYQKDAICPSEGTTVKDIVSGRTNNRPYAGMCAVVNTGDDENWTGHDLAAANLYGFGRLCFNPDLTSEEIAKEWIELTFGNDADVINSVLKILMMSWSAYEKYTAPLGLGWLVNPAFHYGPSPDGYEYDRWGTYHRADRLGVGVERNSTGTGYAGLYNEPNASNYEKLETTPEELILFFHRVEYDYVLSTGKTLLQHIYDTHFEGVKDAEEMQNIWLSLEGKIDNDTFNRAKERFEHQVWHSKEWCDIINSFFYRFTLIPDEQGRPLY